MHRYIYIRNDFCMNKLPIIQHTGKLGAIRSGDKFETIGD